MKFGGSAWVSCGCFDESCLEESVQPARTGAYNLRTSAVALADTSMFALVARVDARARFRNWEVPIATLVTAPCNKRVFRIYGHWRLYEPCDRNGFENSASRWSLMMVRAALSNHLGNLTGISAAELTTKKQSHNYIKIYLVIVINNI